MDRFQSMAVFTRVVASGSLSKAGRELGMSPAGVSHHLRALEDWLGARLLNRTTRRLSLTEVGTGFHARCVRILEEVEEARSAVDALQATPRGLLRVNAPITFGMRHLSPAIADYLAAHPEMAIDIALSDRRVDLLEEGIDVAIRIGVLADSSLVARRLAPSRSVLCAAPAYVERFGSPSSPADLVHHQCLEYTYRSTPGEWRFVGPEGKEESVSIRGRLTATNGELLRIAALRGLGLTLAPTFIVGEDLAAGRLVCLMPGYEPAEVAIHAVYPQGRHLSAKVRSFVDFLAARFGKEPEWDRPPRRTSSSRSGGGRRGA
ncbi:LysR family transcriptional regulator [Archangium violaceum]|uniref:LysR family transcriptional regulator n=1 Tax=Archangium violaceum TaxID=83451 RepID=UPI00193BE096|nr:LysR family transcriptional regulator [Archangium violaceum]QRK06261.1 LysR family transcriptional regulator [Archangium violaceum]